MGTAKLDAHTFTVVMDKVTELVRSQTGTEAHTQAMTLSTALFRVLKFVRTENPELYHQLQLSTLTKVRESWGLAVHRHMAELEKEHGDKGVDRMDPEVGS